MFSETGEFVQHLRLIGFYVFKLLKRAISWYVCTWLCVAIVYCVDLAVVGGSLRQLHKF